MIAELHIERLTGYFILETCDHLVSSILKHSNILNLSIGDSLESSYICRDSFHFLLDGQLRHIVDLENNSQYSTLAKYGHPFIFNIERLLFHSSFEHTLLCSTDCVFLSIKSTFLFQLFDECPELRNFCAVAVLLDSISIIQNSPQYPDLKSISEIKELLSSISHSLSAYYLSDLSEFDKICDYSSHVYLGETLSNHNYASTLDKDSFIDIPYPIRVLALPSGFNIIKSDYQNSEPTVSYSQLQSSNSLPLSSRDSHSDANIDSSNLSSRKVPVPSIDSGENPRIKHYISSDDNRSEIISCFRSLAFFCNLPIKTDVFERIIFQKYPEPESNISFEFCSALAESLGLQTQLLSLPIPLLARLQVPALIRLNSNEPSIVVENKSNILTLIRPRAGVGVCKLNSSQLSSLCSDSDSIPVLIFRKTDLTPEKKFGLSWFLPSLRKHKRALIEVFVASFFVQLFQLMNPLIVQQIIDKVIGQGGTGTLPVLAFMIFVFALFENILTALRTNLFIETTNRIDISLGEQVIDHLLRLPLSYFDKRPVGELSSRLSELENIRSFLTGTALTVVLDVLFSVIYIAVMIMYSWILSIVALLLAPILAIITYSLSPILRAQLRTKAELNASTQNHLVEVLTGIQTVKAQT